MKQMMHISRELSLRSLTIFHKSPHFNRLLANLFSLSTAQMIRLGLNTLLSILIANILGVYVLGQYSILMAFLIIFQEMTNAGVQRLTVREVARNKAKSDEWYVNVLTNQFIASIVMTIILFIIVTYFPYDSNHVLAIRVVAFSLIPFAFVSTAESFIQAYEKMHYLIILQLTGRGVQLLGSLILLYLGYGLIALAWMILLGQIVSCGVSIPIVKRLFLWKNTRINIPRSLSLFRDAFDFNLIQMSVILFNKLDVFILSLFVSPLIVGLYNAAWLIIQLVTTVLASLGNVIYPLLSRTYNQALSTFKKYFLSVLIFGSGVALFITIFVYEFAEDLLAIPFKDEAYLSAAPILQILSPFIILFMCNSIFSSALFASNLQRYSVIVAMTKLIIGIFIYILLIEKFGVIGAAVATVITGLIGTTLNSFFTQKIFLNRNSV